MFHTLGIRGKVQNRYLANKVWLKVPAKGVHSFEFLVGTSNYCTCQQSYNQIFLAQFLAITKVLWILLVISRTRLQSNTCGIIEVLIRRHCTLTDGQFH